MALFWHFKANDSFDVTLITPNILANSTPLNICRHKSQMTRKHIPLKIRFMEQKFTELQKHPHANVSKLIDQKF